MGSHDAADDASERQQRSLRRHVAVALFGLLLIAVGLAVDFVLHALDPDLAGEEGLFTVKNPGHLFLAVGIAATALGLSGAASVMINASSDEVRVLRVGRLSLGVGLVALIISLGYIAAGPGFGHGHGDVADALNLSDGTRLSSAVAADVDRSRLPPGEAVALATLAWSRSGSLTDAELRHDHEDSESAAADLTPGQAEALAAQIAAAAEVIPAFNTPEGAEAAGYMRGSNNVSGVGAHWIKWSLVDRPFDPAAPSMLLFEEVKLGEGPELVGLSYWVSSPDEPEGFAGDTDVWHRHFGLCFHSGMLYVEDIPDRSSCEGDWINGSDLWMLHAWIVPGMENRLGQFAVVNPRLTTREIYITQSWRP